MSLALQNHPLSEEPTVNSSMDFDISIDEERGLQVGHDTNRSDSKSAPRLEYHPEFDSLSLSFSDVFRRSSSHQYHAINDIQTHTASTFQGNARRISPHDKTTSPLMPPTIRDVQNLEEEDHIQFATYPLNMEPLRRTRTRSIAPTIGRPWVPLPLRPYFWIPFIIFAICIAVGLEIALHFNNKNKGWSDPESEKLSLMLHYVYTLLPVASASLFVAMWAWTDAEIKKIEPYVDLVHGDSPPHRSLLLDYTRYNNFVVWIRAAANRHYLVALTSLTVVSLTALGPLASALFDVKSTYRQEPDATTTNNQAIGLNQNPQFNDLTIFLTAAGYAGASILYNVSLPNFVSPPYTIASFDMPTSATNNGTAFVNTTAVRSNTGCQPLQVQRTNISNSNGIMWMNSVDYNGCSFTWNVTNNSTILFGTNTLDCDAYSPPQFNPIIFWIFSYLPTPPQSFSAFCQPSISLWEVNVGIDIATKNVTSVTELRPFSSNSSFSSFSANVTGPPLNGRAFNGIEFNLTNPDSFVLARQDATKLQLPAAVYQSAVQSPEGFVASFNSDTYTILSNHVYQLYLSTIASKVYFVDDNEPIHVQVMRFHNRVWLNAPVVHLLAILMLLLAFSATIVHFFHRKDRRTLHLRHEPGTIASAVSFSAHTEVSEVLADRHAEKEIEDALQNKRFRMDPVTMKIIMEGEDGYDSAISTPRRSVFEVMQGQRERRTSNTNSVRSGAQRSPLSPWEQSAATNQRVYR